MFSWSHKKVHKRCRKKQCVHNVSHLIWRTRLLNTTRIYCRYGWSQLVSTLDPLLTLMQQVQMGRGQLPVSREIKVLKRYCFQSANFFSIKLFQELNVLLMRYQRFGCMKQSTATLPPPSPVSAWCQPLLHVSLPYK